jgi:hypothetical protein
LTPNIYSQTKSNEDYEILNKILDQQKETIFLVELNSNKFVIDQIKLFQKFEDDKMYFELDRLKQSSNIKNDTLLTSEIFNKTNYTHFINQLEENSKWDKKWIKNKIEFHKNKSNKYIYISKPVYTINKKFALVYVGKKTSVFTIVFIKNEELNWEEYKIIFPMLKQPRVNVMKE